MLERKRLEVFECPKNESIHKVPGEVGTSKEQKLAFLSLHRISFMHFIQCISEMQLLTLQQVRRLQEARESQLQARRKAGLGGHDALQGSLQSSGGQTPHDVNLLIEKLQAAAGSQKGDCLGEKCVMPSALRS